MVGFLGKLDKWLLLPWTLRRSYPPVHKDLVANGQPSELAFIFNEGDDHPASVAFAGILPHLARYAI